MTCPDNHYEVENGLAVREQLMTKTIWKSNSLGWRPPLIQLVNFNDIYHWCLIFLQVKDTVSNFAKDASKHATLKRLILDHFECKICKLLPVGKTIVTTSCCNQLLGCHSCFQRATDSEFSCPLCRSEDAAAFPLKGFDQLVNSVTAFSED